MIRIVKPLVPPNVLATLGTAAAQEHNEHYEASPTDFRSGKKSFRFRPDIYAAREVKDELLAAQHEKCAFCESKVRHISYGDIEHFRPKAGYRQRPEDNLKRPGYYWLAYDWDNLFFCCQLCNQEFKKNHFPLKNARKRARTHKHRIDNEEPLMIQPVRIDPVSHIEFREESAVARNGSAEGESTIRLLGLNRPALKEARMRRLQDLKTLLTLRKPLQDKVAALPNSDFETDLANVEASIQRSMSETSEYSAMAHCFLNV